jgi:hypothetical protein
MKLRLPIVALLGGVLSCRGPTAPEPFRSAPEQLVVAGLPVSVELDLWRDFTPIPPSTTEGGPLSASVHLAVKGHPQFPSHVREAQVWVLNGDQVWSTELRAQNERPLQIDRLYLMPTAGGPRWGPGVPVDVVISVRDEQGVLTMGITRHVDIRKIE